MHTITYRIAGYFEAEIFAEEAKFKFQRTKITNFEEFSIELVATIIYNYGFINIP